MRRLIGKKKHAILAEMDVLDKHSQWTEKGVFPAMNHWHSFIRDAGKTRKKSFESKQPREMIFFCILFSIQQRKHNCDNYWEGQKG